MKALRLKIDFMSLLAYAIRSRPVANYRYAQFITPRAANTDQDQNLSLASVPR
jgi:hypothetical protein